MNIRAELPPDAIEEIVAAVTARVLAELGSTPSAAPSAFLTIPEAAELLRCPRQRVDDLLSQGRLNRHKDGRRTLVSRAELAAHLAGGNSERPVSDQRGRHARPAPAARRPPASPPVGCGGAIDCCSRQTRAVAIETFL